MIALLKSRRFWATVVGLVVLIIKTYWPEFPIAEEQLTELVLLLVAFIVGDSLRKI